MLKVITLGQRSSDYNNQMITKWKHYPNYLFLEWGQEMGLAKTALIDYIIQFIM